MRRLFPALRISLRHRRALRLSAVLITSTAITSALVAEGAPFYWSFGGPFAFCFERLPSIEPCPLDPIIVEDMEICFSISGNTMGNNQSRFSLDNLVSVNPIYALAVAVNDDALTSASHNGVQQDWETALVTRAVWNAGFTFPGSVGVWTPPNTVGAFDALFGVGVNQAAVYWVSATRGTPLTQGFSNTNFFVGPAHSTSPALPSSRPVVTWGDGLQLFAGPAPMHKLQQLGFTHTALGAAQLSSDATGRLIVSNIGSSGLDGVSIDLGQTEGWSGDIEQVAPVPFGSAYDITLLGRINATDNLPIVTIRTEDASTALDAVTNITTTFGNSPATVHVTLFDLTGALIGEYDTNSPSMMVITTEGVPAIKARPRGTVCEPNGDGGIIDTGGNSLVTEFGTAFAFSGVRTIRVQGVNPASIVDFASSVVVTGTNTNNLRFTTEKMQSGISLVKPVAGAQFDTPTIGTGAWRITNIGSSGSDGVVVDPRDVTRGYRGARDLMLFWEPLLVCSGATPPPPMCNPDNASLELRSTGVVGGVPDSFLGSMLIQNNPAALGPGVQISADYTPIGATSFQIEVYSAGALVTTLTGVPTGFVASAPDWPNGCGKGEANIGPIRTACYRASWPGDVSLDFGPLGVIIGDELRVLAENPTAPFDHLDTFEVLASEIHNLNVITMPINPFTATFDFDSSGAVGAVDLAMLLGKWGNPFGAADLANLIGVWGPNP